MSYKMINMMKFTQIRNPDTAIRRSQERRNSFRLAWPVYDRIILMEKKEFVDNSMPHSQRTLPSSFLQN
jgi:hypothetical protein